MFCSVLESDPEFGFEQAKQQLQGKTSATFLSILRKSPEVSKLYAKVCVKNFSHIFIFPERPWLVDAYTQWIERLKVRYTSKIFRFFLFAGNKKRTDKKPLNCSKTVCAG